MDYLVVSNLFWMIFVLSLFLVLSMGDGDDN